MSSSNLGSSFVPLMASNNNTIICARYALVVATAISIPASV